MNKYKPMYSSKPTRLEVILEIASGVALFPTMIIFFYILEAVTT